MGILVCTKALILLVSLRLNIDSKGMVATFCYQKPHLGNFSVLLENDARHASL